jgi:hypothetical protein
MENHAADDRMLRLERALLARRRRSVPYDAAGDADLAALRAELAELGFDFIGCDVDGFAYEAEFRRPARHRGERATRAIGRAFSEHNAIVEAAIAALELPRHVRNNDDDGPGQNLSPAPIERLRHARPWRKRIRSLG